MCLQGALALVFTLLLVWRALDGASEPGRVLGQAAYFAILGGGVLAVGIALLRGLRGARTPAIVVQVLLLGVAWYAAGPSGRPEYGIPVALVCLTCGAALLSPPARTWSEPPT